MKKLHALMSGAALFLVLTFIDQTTKYLAVRFLAGTSGISLIPGVFELFYLENRGAAFGMFRDQQWFFILAAVLITLIAAYIIWKLPCKKYYYPLYFVCILMGSGAIGNMIDRIVNQYVIDFLYVSLIDFPVFNIADCYVCIGAGLAILLLFTRYKDEEFEFLIPFRNH